MDSETRNRSASTSSTGWPLPHKAAVSPAAVFAEPVNVLSDSIPRDYFSVDGSLPPAQRTATSSGATSTSSTHGGKAITTTPMTTNEELLTLTGGRRASRVSGILSKTIDSPPHSPKLNNFTITESPYSSTDSLASLVERQQHNKIIHPSHYKTIFCNDTHLPLPQRRATHHAVDTGRRSSTASLIAVLQGQQHKKRVSDSIPMVKSPLHLSLEADADESRRLNPHHNPHHVHSSPSVKESKTVSLGYDPVSRKKMLNSYEIVKEIGRGEHGKVKLAKHLETDELVAIKIVDRKGPRKSFRPGSSHEEKIRREIAIMKKINHPNVVQLKEVMDDANSRKIYLVLEYLEKGEVKWQKAKDVPMMKLDESLQVFRDIVLGLEYLHYQGIVHRDIKPANLLIAGDGSVKISDFGVSFASSLKTGEQDDYDLAKTAGTPAFLAPELCRPLDEDEERHPKITYKIDIWALGVTLYCFLFGKLPFWATNEFELFDVIYTKELEFPKNFTDDYSEEDKSNALDLLTKILDKDPKNRLTIKEIKRHPLTLRGLTEEEADTYTEEQKSCEHKIDVSSEEVQVAVTGLGSKLRKGFAKALKFAGFPSGKKLPHTDPATPLEESLKEHEIFHSSHRRVKSGDVSSETHANVEGDLFLNKGSALNSLCSIYNDDKRKSSVSLYPERSVSTAPSESMSNDSSLSRGTQLVSLPVNASFASLDSVYLDNFAPSYAYGSAADARAPPAAHKEALFSKMSDFEMNKTAEKKGDDAVAPHVQPSSKFMLHEDDFSDDDDDDDEHEEDEYDEFDDDNTDHVSELSVPSYLIQDFGGQITEGPVVTKSSTDTSGSSKLPIRGAPKYSFFETSDDDDDNFDSDHPYERPGPEVIFAESSDEEDFSPLGPTVPLHRFRTAESSPVQTYSRRSSSSSEEELTLSFNPLSRQHSTLAIPKRPDRVASPLANNAPKTPIASSNAHLISQPHPLSQYSNHYNRVSPQVSYTKPSESEARARSNSITVGLLKGQH